MSASKSDQRAGERRAPNEKPAGGLFRAGVGRYQPRRNWSACIDD